MFSLRRLQFTISLLDWACLILEFFAGALGFYNLYLLIAATNSKLDIEGTIFSMLGREELRFQIIILTLIISIFILTAVSAFARALSRKRLRSILQLNWDLGVLIILPSITFDKETKSVMRATPVDGNDAARIFPPLLEAAGVAASNISVRVAGEISNQDLLNNNAIVIGGHITNELSAIVVHMRDNDRQCALIDDQIKHSGGLLGIEFDPKDHIQDAPENGTDYCLITRDDMPNGSKKRTFWAFEGIRHWGTRGALQMIGDITIREHRKSLLKACPQLKKAGEIQMIAACRFNVTKDFNEKSCVEKYFWKGAEQQVRKIANSRRTQATATTKPASQNAPGKSSPPSTAPDNASHPDAARTA